jgi:hypothetical protein
MAVNSINSSIQALNRELICGPECQSNKRAQTLKLAYDNAINDYNQSPEKINQLEKDFYIETKGRVFYNNVLEKKYRQEATDNTKKYKEEYETITSDIIDLITEYDSSVIYFNRLIDLYNKVKSENVELMNKHDYLKGSVNTNNRKTFYENQQIDSLGKWKYRIQLLYWAIFIVIFIKTMFIQKEYKNYKAYIKLFLIAATPYLFIGIIIYLILAVKNTYYSIKKYMGIKDVYTDIANE